MAWSITAGTPVTGFNTTITPTIPAFTVGQIGYLQSQSYMGTLPTPTIPGWQRISPSTVANQVVGWLRILQAGDTGPAISWGNQWASAWVDIIAGGPATLSGILHSSSDKANSTTNTIDYNSLSVSQPGCLLIAGGARNKTATSNGGVFGNIPGFTTLNTSVIAGTALAAVTNYQIQTTAANISLTGQTYTLDSSQQYESFIIALQPTVTQVPIPAWPRQVFVKETIEQY